MRYKKIEKGIFKSPQRSGKIANARTGLTMLVKHDNSCFQPSLRWINRVGKRKKVVNLISMIELDLNQPVSWLRYLIPLCRVIE